MFSHAVVKLKKMFKYICDWIIYLSWRIAITFVCALTFNHFVSVEGYRLADSTLIISMVAAVVLIKIWTYKE